MCMQPRLERCQDDEELCQQLEALMTRHQGHVVHCEGLVGQVSWPTAALPAAHLC